MLGHAVINELYVMSIIALAFKKSCQCITITLAPLPPHKGIVYSSCDRLTRRLLYLSISSPVNIMHSTGEHRPKIFRLSDYDCVGFDLDNTILRYNLINTVKLEYDLLAKFLVEEKGYEAQYLQGPLKETDFEFLQKGLILDYENGNVLQLAPNGSVQRASHGTKFLDEETLISLYGKDKYNSTMIREYCQNILGAWNGPLSKKVRACLDYFDIPVPLAFARCVDSLEATKSDGIMSVNLYEDILAGLVSMYDYENFRKDAGGFFSAIKKEPHCFLHKCSSNVHQWLRDIKKEKITFLITGSYVDFASFTANYCLGENWQSLFDIVICQARKPGFFTSADRSFLEIVDMKTVRKLPIDEIKFGSIYAQGDWQTLFEIFKQKTCLRNPKCVYMGDNLIQDVYAVNNCTTCDAVAVNEEMRCEPVPEESSDAQILSPGLWGSYFINCTTKQCSFWSDLIQRHAVICIPNLDALADKPLNFPIQSFTCNESHNPSQPIGYFPLSPFFSVTQDE